MNQKHNIDLLVISCDAYADVWDLFFNVFFKSWKDCPLDIYLLTNQKSFDIPKVQTLNIGPDITWSDNLLKGLSQLKKDYVLIILEDLMIKKNVSSKYFSQISNWINENQPNYLRLTNSHKPKKYDSLVGVIPDKTPYKTSTMPCVWKINTLIKILKSGESAWDFETKGSRRAYQYTKFFSVYQNFINYHNSIIKGKWRRTILKDGFGQSLDIHPLSRPIMSTLDEWLYFFRKIKSYLFNMLSNELKMVFKG